MESSVQVITMSNARFYGYLFAKVEPPLDTLRGLWGPTNGQEQGTNIWCVGSTEGKGVVSYILVTRTSKLRFCHPSPLSEVEI